MTVERQNDIKESELSNPLGYNLNSILATNFLNKPGQTRNSGPQFP